jgi:hypothetical protein
MRSEDVAFARLAAIGPSAAEKARIDEINKSIDITMRQVIRDAKYNPNALDAPMTKVVPQGAAPAKEPGVPEWKGLAEPWKSSLPQQDWLRLGSTVADANLKSAEAALAKLGEEEEPTKG